MSIAKFSMKDVEKVYFHAMNLISEGVIPTPSPSQLFDGSFYKGGKPLDKNGLTQEQVGNGLFWPDKNRMTEKPVQVMLNIVGDHGVYIMSNVKEDGHKPVCAYAKGANPDKDSD